MYRTKKEPFGFEVTLGGKITLDQMKQWRFESVQALVGAPESFSVLFDMRELRATELDPEVQELLTEGRQLFRREGMLRSCVILDNHGTTTQYRRRAKKSKEYTHERYIDASANPMWRAKAIDWLEKKVDPEA
jgi:hypothetical protein